MNLSEKINIMRNSQFFSSTSSEILEVLSKKSEIHQYRSGDLVVKEGDYGTSMFFIFKGKIKIHLGEKILQELGPYDYFGELAMLSSEKRLASVSAIENSILLEIKQEQLFELINTHKHLAIEIISTLCNKVKSIIQLERELHLKEKLVSFGMLTSGLAHELKNPLNFAMHYSIEVNNIIKDLLLEVSKDKEQIDLPNLRIEIEEISKHLSVIEKHCKRANLIINDLLLHVHISEAEMEIKSLAELIDRAIELSLRACKIQSKLSSINVVKNYDSTVDHWHIAESLERVFLNLIDNACYAMYKRCQADPSFVPQLEISIMPHAKGVCIKIKDNGGGIELAILDKIFQPFFTTKPTGVGTGLGLSISYDIVVNQHKGKICVASDHKNYTEFTIILPK